MSETSASFDVTVGIPVFNNESFIQKCLMSIFNQTFNGSMEVLIVNDGCTDNTIQIINNLQNTHPKGNLIRIINHSLNLGVGCSRNTILKEALGKYVLFVDSDDYVTPDCILKLYSEAEKNHAEVVYGSVKTVNTDAKLSYLSQPYKVFCETDELASYAFQNIHENLRNYVWNTLFLMSFLREHQLEFPKNRFHEDVIFSTNLVPLVTKGVLLPDITYFYVIREHSLSNIQGRTNIDQDEGLEFIHIYTYVKNKNRELKGKPYYEARCARSMTQMLYIVSGLLKNRHVIKPPLTNKMIKDAMKHPASLVEILKFRKYKWANLAFFTLGVLPSWLTVSIISIIAKYKHLI